MQRGRHLALSLVDMVSKGDLDLLPSIPKKRSSSRDRNEKCDFFSEFKDDFSCQYLGKMMKKMR
jgi:hypothetical protein